MSSLTSFLLALALAPLADTATPCSTCPRPDDPIWGQVIERSGAAQLARESRRLPVFRLVRDPVCLTAVTVVTIRSTADGGLATVRAMRDRSTREVVVTRHPITRAQWTELVSLAEWGLWHKQAVRPSDAPPNLIGGTHWYVEGVSSDGRSAIVRHEPTDREFIRLCNFILELSGLADTAPSSWFWRSR